MNTYIYIAPIS